MYVPPKKRVTLPEKIAVGVIVLVIAAIVLPVSMHPRDFDNQDLCAENEKQLALSMLEYAQDSDGFFPPGLSKSGLGWGGELYPYVKFRDVYSCAQDRRDVPDKHDANEYPISYALNSNVIGHKFPVSMTNMIDNPSNTVLLFETAGSYFDPKSDDILSDPSKQHSPTGNGLDGQLRCEIGKWQGPVRYATGAFDRPTNSDSQFSDDDVRHSGGANYAIVDGHVIWMKPEDVSPGLNATNPTAPETGGLMGNAAGTQNLKYKATFSVR
mgnify:CR=1 FL=1